MNEQNCWPMFSRREALQIGCSGFFGVSLTTALAARAAAAAKGKKPIRSVVLVFLTGGHPQHEMFDPKPNAPKKVRGEFNHIATTIPGVRFGSLIPQMAKRADKMAIVRTMAHRDNRHLSGTHNTLTGHIQPFRGNSNQAKQLNRADWPCYGGGIALLGARNNGMPSQVTVHKPLIEGTLVWPGQHAGWLGPKHDPFRLNDDPNRDNFHVSGLSLRGDLNIDRLSSRRSLLKGLNREIDDLDRWAQEQQFTSRQDIAFSMLTSGKLKKALNISKETKKTRDRYGRHLFGQNMLLARRLVEAEVPVIQCNMGRVQTWDSHVAHFPRMKSQLPPLDKGVGALIDDLEERNLLDETFIVIVGEFGRTPSISPLPKQKLPGRHHWAWGYTATFIGGGVQPGQVIGKSDRLGGRPTTKAFHPNDLGATVYSLLGIDPHTAIADRFDRPIQLNTGTPMSELFDGSAV